MAITDYSYDPTGIVADNLIQDEIQSVNVGTTRAVFPINHAFFADGFKIYSLTEKEGGGYDELLLEEGTDYIFSPMFLNASAQTTGKSVFTYIVLLVDVTKVSLDYQSLGQYQDEVLLEQIVASSHDRTKAYGWAQLDGTVTNFNVRAREKDLNGQSLIEVLANKTTLIAQALSSPNSNFLNMAMEMTKFEEKLDKKVSMDAFGDWVNTPSKEIDLAAVSATTLHIVPADKHLTKMVIYYKADDNSEDLGLEAIIMNGIEASHNETNEQGDANLVITTVKSGNTTVVSVTAIKAGKLTVKVLSEI